MDPYLSSNAMNSTATQSDVIVTMIVPGLSWDI